MPRQNLLSLVVAALLAAPAAYAQEHPQAVELQAVTVTGSRIPAWTSKAPRR